MRTIGKIFSTPEVTAILAGKTMFREVVKPQPDSKLEPFEVFDAWKAPYAVGDVIYVRETWWSGYVLDENERVPDDTPLDYWYFADTKDSRPFDASDEWCYHIWGNNKECWPRWRSPATMPREAARIFLEVVSVKVERLHEIRREGIRAEGIRLPVSPRFTPDDTFSELHKEYRDFWQSKHGADSWDANPWVWAVEFKRIDKPDA